MHISDFQFDLPDELIALRPAEPRDSARLLVVHADGSLVDAQVAELPNYLKSGDIMVFNDTRVLPAALKGVRSARNSDGKDVKVDVNLLERRSGSSWRAMVRPGRRLRDGDIVMLEDGSHLLLDTVLDDGSVILSFSQVGTELDDLLDRIGLMPLPPYIARKRGADEKDRSDYQTMFATGAAASVAAPTAGLHFTPDLLGRLDDAGIKRDTVRLNVGAGTFAPLKPEQMASGRLHEEWCDVRPETADRLNEVRSGGGRIVPVGTTALRTLESAVTADGRFDAFSGTTDIFLRPGSAIRSADVLMTNFHLSGSSLFMLVCALMGTEVMRAAYDHAIRQRYRFFSYGDACLLVRNG